VLLCMQKLAKVRSGDSTFPEDELLRWVGVAEKFAERLNS